jgi:signal transduction histidine kinase
MGALVLSGWTFNVQPLMQLIPTLVAMNPMTALGFILAGYSFFRLGSKDVAQKDIVAILCAAGVALLGMIRLFDCIFGLNFHIDRLLFPSKVSGSVGYPPNEMAANTALNLFLCGVALLLNAVGPRKGSYFDQALVLVAGWVALLAIIGYTYHILLFYRLGVGLPMSLDSAVAFVLFCAAYLAGQPERGVMRVLTSRTSGGVMARRLLPMAILIPWGLGAILLVLEQAGIFGKEFAVSLFAVTSVIVFTVMLWWNASLLHQVDLERASTEAQLRQSGANLQRSNTDLQQFAYIASHDLLEPLRMVTSYAQLVQQRYQDKLDKQGNEFLGQAIDGARRMEALIHDLLAFSRVEMRGRPFERTDCEQILQQALRNLKVAIEETGAVVSHEVLPTVMGDGIQLIQVFQNLVGNAIKFKGPRPPEVQVRSERKGSDWLFVVRDNGIGIDPKFFDRIFVIFQRLHTRQQYAGTGMGLAICKKIIERHGGQIRVESKPNEGAAFFFTLPAIS